MHLVILISNTAMKMTDLCIEHVLPSLYKDTWTQERLSIIPFQVPDPRSLMLTFGLIGTAMTESIHIVHIKVVEKVLKKTYQPPHRSIERGILYTNSSL